MPEETRGWIKIWYIKSDYIQMKALMIRFRYTKCMQYETHLVIYLYINTKRDDGIIMSLEVGELKRKKLQKTRKWSAAALKKNIRKNYELYLFVLPAFLVLILFNYVPIYGLQIAFKEFIPSKGILGSQWVGLKHFIRFVTGYQFGNLMKNTFVLALQVILFTFPIPVIFALFINQLKNGWRKNVIQTVSYMPHFISTVVIAGMLLVFLSPRSGIINTIIGWLGGEKVNFMGIASWFRPLYILSEIWQHTGWESIVFVAALSSVDPTYYEAAKMDGAGRLKRMMYIDLPMLVPTMIIIFILKVGYVTSAGGSAMSPVFEKVFLMQNDLNLSASEVIATYVYKIGLKSQQYSYSAAIGLFTTLISFTLVAVMNRISKKMTGAGLW